MRKVFKDPELQARFERDGVVIVPVLNAEEVAALKQIYIAQEAATADKKEFHLTLHNDAEDYKDSLHYKLSSITAPRLNEHVIDYRPLLSCFAVKNPGPDTKFGLHQAVTFVDETKFTSITCWIPLQDVDQKNGNMQAVKGSHKFFDQQVRSQHYPNPFEHLIDYLTEKYTTDFPMKAGHAWIFNHRLLHCSPPNNTDKVRVAVLNAMVPAEATVSLYYKHKDKKQEKQVEILEFTQENYHMQDFLAKPSVPGLESRGFAEEKHYKVTKEEIDNLYKQHIGAPPTKSKWNKLTSFFR